jgi:hypothetical protein
VAVSDNSCLRARFNRARETFRLRYLPNGRIGPMESRGPQFQKQLSHIEELINALNGAADPTLSAKSRELTQALLELRGAGLDECLN